MRATKEQCIAGHVNTLRQLAGFHRDTNTISDVMWEHIKDIMGDTYDAGTFSTQPEPEVTWEQLPEYGEHMTMEDWTAAVDGGCLRDYDGFGKYASVDKMSSETVVPSDIEYGNLNTDPEYTHVVWFNR